MRCEINAVDNGKVKKSPGAEGNVESIIFYAFLAFCNDATITLFIQITIYIEL